MVDPRNQGASPGGVEENATSKSSSDADAGSRRSFIATCGNVVMASGLIGGYGTLGYCALRYLTPDERDTNLDWQIVDTLDRLKGKSSITFTAASGAKIVIAPVNGDGGETDVEEPAESGQADDAAAPFLALSSVCPHLGCQVHWEAQNDRFFCPCHNGTFDRSGKATGGPPAEANQSLTQYPTRILNGALYVYAPVKNVTSTRG